jgi:hypothetical protein
MAPPLLLELFSGTGSVGKTAKKNGWEVISVDENRKCAPTIVADVCELRVEDLPPPTFIWASPPCTTYSLAATWYKHRDPKTGTAWTAEAVQADRLLERTLCIIQHFLSSNPDLKFCIENPRAYMRRMPCMQELQRTSTSYNQYGFPFCKPTDLWSNYPLHLKPVKFGGIRIGKDDRWRKRLRHEMGVLHPHLVAVKGDSASSLGRIPGELVEEVLRQSTVSSTGPP